MEITVHTLFSKHLSVLTHFVLSFMRKICNYLPNHWCTDRIQSSSDELLLHGTYRDTSVSPFSSLTSTLWAGNGKILFWGSCWTHQERQSYWHQGFPDHMAQPITCSKTTVSYHELRISSQLLSAALANTNTWEFPGFWGNCQNIISDQNK